MEKQMTALVWIWRHGSADVERYDSTDEAIRHAWYACQSDECWMEGVEVDGVFIDHDEHPEWKRLEAAAWANADAQIAADKARPVTHRIELMHPQPSREGTDRYTTVEWVHSAEEAERLLGEWRARVAPERVRVVPARLMSPR
jgi:hypothetical protein